MKVARVLFGLVGIVTVFLMGWVMPRPVSEVQAASSVAGIRQEHEDPPHSGEVTKESETNPGVPGDESRSTDPSQSPVVTDAMLASAARSEDEINEGASPAVAAEPAHDRKFVRWQDTGEVDNPFVPVCPLCGQEVRRGFTGCFGGHTFEWREVPRDQQITCRRCSGAGDLRCSTDNVLVAASRGYIKPTRMRNGANETFVCSGSGKAKSFFFPSDPARTCPSCKGRGRFPCFSCGGDGMQP